MSVMLLQPWIMREAPRPPKHTVRRVSLGEVSLPRKQRTRTAPSTAGGYERPVWVCAIPVCL